MNRAERILSKCSLDEKAMLLSQGLIEQNDTSQYGLTSFYVADGPSGIRTRDEIPGKKTSVVCYPSVSTYACSWDRELIHTIGRYLGVEAKTVGVDVLFGPGCNIKRSPLGGRNFEYYSEDPVLTGELATEYVKGIQAEGVGACVKHFAANNQETRRMSIDERIDERALHEIYLKAFEKPIKEGKPYMVMTAYNKVNGEYCANHSLLLKQILRDQWKYDGNVITDCVAAHDLAQGIKNGLNLQLSSESAERIADEVKELIAANNMTESDVDQAVLRTIELSMECKKRKREEDFDPEEHHKFAEKIAVESMVLLKNENDFLPLREKDSICVIGKIGKSLRFQGGGSAHVTPYRVDQVYDAVKEYCPDAVFAKGYEEEDTCCEWEQEAIQKAAEAEKVIFCMGLPESGESEGYDRMHMKLPLCQELLLEKVCKVNPNVVVLLFHGSPVEMSWSSRPKAILDVYLPGEAGGKAIGKLLFGKNNPCGKLAETVPVKLADTPCYLNFPGKGNRVNYAESVYVGYRYYDKKEMEVAFPFGYGMSYTTFSYKNLEVQRDGNNIEVSLTVKNTGNMEGKEIVQLYVKKPGILYDCPLRELQNFMKIGLKPGEEQKVRFLLTPENFQVYDEEAGRWVTEGGIYGIEVGKSSREICLSSEVELEPAGIKEEIKKDTVLEDIINRFAKKEMLEELFAGYPTALQILELCDSRDITLRAMQLSNTFETLKRSDSMITDAVIQEILEKLNA